MTALRTAALAVREAYLTADVTLMDPRLRGALDDLLDADPTETDAPAVRRSDPATSRAGAASSAMRSGSQRHRLLITYGSGVSQTADEARRRAGLARTSCYWKRCSELREAGLIADTGRTRPGDAGDEQMVCAVTDAGLAVLSRLVDSSARHLVPCEDCGQPVSVPVIAVRGSHGGRCRQ